MQRKTAFTGIKLNSKYDTLGDKSNWGSGNVCKVLSVAIQIKN